MKYVTYKDEKYYLLENAMMSDDGKTYQALAISEDGRDVYEVLWENLYADVPMTDWPLGEGEEIMCDWDVVYKVEHVRATGRCAETLEELKEIGNEEI